MVKIGMFNNPVLLVTMQWFVFGLFKAVQAFSFFSFFNMAVCPNSH